MELCVGLIGLIVLLMVALYFVVYVVYRIVYALRDRAQRKSEQCDIRPLRRSL